MISESVFAGSFAHVPNSAAIASAIVSMFGAMSPGRGSAPWSSKTKRPACGLGATATPSDFTDSVDFQNLSARLRANTVQEKLSNAWLDRIFATKPELRRV